MDLARPGQVHRALLLMRPRRAQQCGCGGGWGQALSAPPALAFLPSGGFYGGTSSARSQPLPRGHAAPGCLPLLCWNKGGGFYTAGILRSRICFVVSVPVGEVGGAKQGMLLAVCVHAGRDGSLALIPLCRHGLWSIFLLQFDPGCASATLGLEPRGSWLGRHPDTKMGVRKAFDSMLRLIQTGGEGLPSPVAGLWPAPGIFGASINTL